MTEATTNEIIKAMAYGFSDEEIAEEECMSIEDVREFRKAHADEIKARR